MTEIFLIISVTFILLQDNSFFRGEGDKKSQLYGISFNTAPRITILESIDSRDQYFLSVRNSLYNLRLNCLVSELRGPFNTYAEFFHKIFSVEIKAYIFFLFYVLDL